MKVSDQAPPEMAARTAYGRLSSPLPYAVQSGYDRTFRERAIPAFTISNHLVSATVLPTLGGRVWSMRDQVSNRELLFANPQLAYANLGLTDAWFAGGIEWNLGSTGHTCQSSRPMHVGLVADGSVLRLWEWERTRDLVLQVDLSLEGARLVASTRVINPDPEPKPLYYWTNIAVPQTPGTRVLTTADAAWRTDYDGVLERVSIPHPEPGDVDVSYPVRSAASADYFYDVSAQQGRHIVAVEPSGLGFAQTSTSGLTGRKLFLWGSSAGGDRWQQWLCGEGRYAEIQAGRCPTQLEHDQIPGNGVVSWTESFFALELTVPPDGPYAETAEAVRTLVHQIEPPDQLEQRHASWLNGIADAPVVDLLATGSGWGAVELRLRRHPGWVGLPFGAVDDESAVAAAWLSDDEINELDFGRLSVPPVSDRWLAALGEARTQNWWTHYVIAVHAHLHGDAARAEASYTRSAELLRTPWALAGLARLAAARNDCPGASFHYAAAQSLAPHVRRLVTEHVQVLLDAGSYDAALAVIAAAPAPVRRHGRTRLLQATALLAAGRSEESAALVDQLEVEDLAEGEGVIGDLWARLHPGVSIAPHLDFRMTAAQPVAACH